MALSAKIKQLLNKFAESQPALNDKDKPHASSAVQLGDLIEQAGADQSATATAYTASTPADWSDSAPATVKEALDRLAAALGPIA